MVPESDVMFVAIYDSGNEERFGIDAKLVRRGGELVAVVIARQHQELGFLPEGHILRVKRADSVALGYTP